MSPRRFDPGIVESRLASMRDLLKDLERPGLDDARGQAPTGYRHSFELAAEHGLISRELADELIPSVGMRNILVHEYLEIDIDKVAVAVKLARDGYRRYLGAVAEYVM